MNDPETDPYTDKAAQFDHDAELAARLRAALPEVEERCRQLEEEDHGWASGCDAAVFAVEEMTKAADSGQANRLAGFVEALEEVAGTLEEDSAELLAWCLLELLDPKAMGSIGEIAGPVLAKLLAQAGY